MDEYYIPVAIEDDLPFIPVGGSSSRAELLSLIVAFLQDDSYPRTLMNEAYETLATDDNWIASDGSIRIKIISTEIDF